MKLHEWVTLVGIARQLNEEPAAVYAGIYRDALATRDPISRAWVTIEPPWITARRPHYLVYPAIIPALTRLKLDLDCGLIHLPLLALLFRLPERNPLSFEHEGYLS